ncbi:hypothetical protein K7432_015657 [Basidiobolus ranarum]|uniref:Protein yippee-like n=1 Tax=Basidiobolus ranarum TaxID=34480 RepID=A0ABR2WFW0_9FUNG
MGFAHKTYLSGNRIFGCKDCKTHFSTLDCLVSKAFQGQYGRAYLFMKVVNVIEGEEAERSMTTGLHVVKDIKCSKCQRTVGWRYVRAYEESQRYKEGQYILERNLLVDVD